MSTVTVNISFPAQLHKTIDAVAKQEARTRSDLLRESVRLYVERKRRWDRLRTFWRREARRAAVTPEEIERAIAHHRTRQRASS